MKKTNIKRKFRRNDEKFLTSDLDPDVVLMNLENGDYIGLNEVASDIWKLLGKETQVEAIIHQLQDIYKVSPEICVADTLECMEYMMDLNLLLEVKDNDSPA